MVSVNKASSTIGEEGRTAMFSLTKQGLMKVKSKALRSGTWYKTLTRIERAIVDLTITCVENVRSQILAEIVAKIISKILRTLEESFMSKAEEVGREIALKLSMVAESWENKTCSLWSFDSSFIKFLGVNLLNTKTSMHMP